MPAPKRQETPFDYWISFWPTAPLFGVKWRYEKMVPGAPFFRPVEVVAQMAAASVEEVARAAEESAEAMVHAAEAVVENVADVDAEIESEAIAETAAELAETADEIAVTEAGSADVSQPESRPALLYDAAPANADDLKQIKGVGPKLEAMLNDMGIFRFDQIAGFTDANLQWVDGNLTAFKGRPFRDDWVAQARALL